ncbi:hypothetical protein K3495_g7943 [Podosphaera aphanis]|nr:hypothetical protein K3495_g7943 [Podosphaera aphanis]
MTTLHYRGLAIYEKGPLKLRDLSSLLYSRGQNFEVEISEPIFTRYRYSMLVVGGVMELRQGREHRCRGSQLVKNGT